jgi:hypothetical protein
MTGGGSSALHSRLQTPSYPVARINWELCTEAACVNLQAYLAKARSSRVSYFFPTSPFRW